MIVKDDKLWFDNTVQVDYIESPNYSNKFEPKYIVLHYTGGKHIEPTIKYFRSNESKVSAHIVIGRDGRVIQMVPFNKCAWHAGESKWGDITSMNLYSIGIELVNSGPVETNCNAFYDMWGSSYDEDEVVCIAHKNEKDPRYWVKYPKMQIESLKAVYRALNETYSILDILGHDDIAPDRKIDPGPAISIPDLKNSILDTY